MSEADRSQGRATATEAESHDEAERVGPEGHGAARRQVAAWRREFRQLTGVDPSDSEQVIRWQAAHGLEPTGQIRRETIETARRSLQGSSTPEGNGLMAPDFGPGRSAHPGLTAPHHASSSRHRHGRRAAASVQPHSDHEAEKFYNLHIELLHKSTDLPHATKEQALQTLGQHQTHIANWIAAERDGHRDLVRIHDESALVAGASEFAANRGEEVRHFYHWIKEVAHIDHGESKRADPKYVDKKVALPELAMWERPLMALRQVDVALMNGDVEAAIAQLNLAAAEFRHCHQRVIEYRERTEKGAETAIGALRLTETACAITFTIASGGLGGGMLGAAATSAVGAGTFAAGTTAAEQASEKHHQLRDKIDFKEILERGLHEAVTTFVGALVGGAMTKAFMRKIGEYLVGKMPLSAIKALAARAGVAGPVTPEFFVTNGWAFLAELAGGVGSTPVVLAVSTALQRYKDGHWPSKDEFIHEVIKEMIQGGAFQIFLGGVMHGKAMVGGGKGNGGGHVEVDPNVAVGEPPPAPPPSKAEPASSSDQSTFAKGAPPPAPAAPHSAIAKGPPPLAPEPPQSSFAKGPPPPAPEPPQSSFANGSPTPTTNVAKGEPPAAVQNASSSSTFAQAPPPAAHDASAASKPPAVATSTSTSNPVTEMHIVDPAGHATAPEKAPSDSAAPLAGPSKATDVIAEPAATAKGPEQAAQDQEHAVASEPKAAPTQATADDFQRMLADPELKLGISNKWTQLRVKEKIAELRANPEVGPLLEKVPDIELTALLGYTGTDYVDINRALRGLKDPEFAARLRPYIELSSAALDRLPNFEGVVVRGIREAKPEILAQYSEFKVTTEAGFMSSSFEEGAFATQTTGELFMKINSKTGKKLDLISMNDNEKEVLFKPGTKFLCTRKELVGERWEIDLTEV